MGGRAWSLVAAVSAAVTLAGCDIGLSPLAPASVPAPAAAPSPESRQLQAYYGRVESSLVSQGLLRTEAAAIDAPFTGAMLARNFERIALFEEYSEQSGRLIPRETESTLHRWEAPIRMTVEFGDSIPEENRARDRSAIIGFATRLGGIMDRSVRQVSNRANFHVFVVNEDERRALGPRLAQVVPGISDTEVRTITDLPRPSYCLVFAWDYDENGSYEQAVAVIRGEHPELLRLSCIHEELAQAMGLSNDSPAARPSVFNDDEEFALLTKHDEMLLRILYDPNLRPGMTAEEARPIVQRLADALVAGPS